jgi:hypothetical protein
MKTLFYTFILITVLIVANGQRIRSNDKIFSISNGVSFGLCHGYCQQSINITSIKNELIALKEPNYIQGEFLPVEKRYPFSLNQWKKLIDLIDDETFRLLDDEIKCYLCPVDAGVEWIEIKWTNGNKRVTFGYGQLIKGFEGIVLKLRKLREKYTNDLLTVISSSSLPPSRGSSIAVPVLSSYCYPLFSLFSLLLSNYICV